MFEKEPQAANSILISEGSKSLKEKKKNSLYKRHLIIRNFQAYKGRIELKGDSLEMMGCFFFSNNNLGCIKKQAMINPEFNRVRVGRLL